MDKKLRLVTALLCGCLWIQSGSAQVLNAPVAAPNQTPPAGSTPWSAACASASFNDYWVNFTWSPPLVNADNEFILELSDADGNFSSPVELARDGSKNTTFDFYFQFALPTDTRGEGYRLRVRSTSPAQTSPTSPAYPMYYLDVNSGITIRPQGQADFGNGTAQVCDGNSITLEVYNLANADTYQYNWYRSGTLLADKGPSISVTQGGMYNAEIDYGACSGSGNTLSNLIDVTSGTSLGIAINPPAKTELCAGETLLLEANISGQGLTYTWLKDGSPITAPTVDNSTYTVDAGVAGFEGDYQVEVFGPGACVEQSAAVSIGNAGNFTVSRDNPASVVVLPGQNTTLQVTSSASGVTYQWYKDGSPVTGATANTLVVTDTQTGSYFARVSLTGGACASTSVDSEAVTVVAPASLEMDIAYSGSYADCANTSVVLEVTEIRALDGGGNATVVTADILAGMSFQWSHDGTPVSGATASSISLADIAENGSYTLEGSISSYNTTSNSLSVNLRVDENLAISSSQNTVCGPAEPVSITTTTDLTGVTFDWFRDGVNLNLGTASIDVGTPGTYQLVIQRNGCPVPSNEVTLTGLDENLITLDPGTDVRIPEGTTRTVNASGGDTYRWLDSNNIELSTASSYAFSEAGQYLLIATIGGCEVARPITISYLDTFRVPNVISVNGDGINDQWILPNTYSGKSDVIVTIYNDKGEEVFNESNYQNNWPASATSFASQNMVFYYKIRSAGKVLKQGTITVIR
ncbi:gliding motility-associated C-terminal domain-containing protein [Robiginitalea sp. M366]|uniref:Ig-like domain-containing protein n=1 Tax=Robiginitalea aestuariiviva TaxID=3036903 RepID=UPI00240DDC20|nr:gliding motility-associated C-terminal domain-containing protein [Robiginitalea aestuariiviva]MDG1571507.1 gliding motility-associated C-terminal domain-containing protein [Robiginitalea aestuariiviva]